MFKGKIFVVFVSFLQATNGLPDEHFLLHNQNTKQVVVNKLQSFPPYCMQYAVAKLIHTSSYLMRYSQTEVGIWEWIHQYTLYSDIKVIMVTLITVLHKYNISIKTLLVLVPCMRSTVLVTQHITLCCFVHHKHCLACQVYTYIFCTVNWLYKPVIACYIQKSQKTPKVYESILTTTQLPTFSCNITGLTRNEPYVQMTIWY